MSYQVLARKYRPQRFADVIGQDHVTRTLKNAIEQQRIAHGYIFSGHRGIGKTTIARILAMALNCRSQDHPVPETCGVCDSCVEIRAGNAVDVIEIDAATNRGIDEIRELRDAARYRPARDRYKIWILDEAHQITDAAFNALLKTLEEPPGHVIFMMATTEPEDIPQTIRSRCQHFSFHAVRFEEITKQLRSIADAEHITADDNALALLAEAGDGSMRDALSIMDQAIACCGERLTADTVRGLIGAVPSEILEELMSAVERNSSEEVLRLVDRLMVEGQNPTHFARQLVRFLRNAIVAKVAGRNTSLLQISADEADRVTRVAEKFSEEDLTRFLQIMLRTHGELGYKHEQRFHLELGLLKMVHAQRLLPLEQILSGAVQAGAKPSSPGTPSVAARPSTPQVASPRMNLAGTAEPAAASGPPIRRVSPFEADSSRKSGPRGPLGMSDSMSAVAAATATAVAEALPIEALPEPTPVANAVVAPSSGEFPMAQLQSAILGALEKAGQSMLAHMMEEGQWSVNGSELIIAVTAGDKLIETVYNKSADAKRIVTNAAAGIAGNGIRVKLTGGATAGGGNGGVKRQPVGGSPGDARSRAASEPVVQRMREKLGAEIRTVVDYKDRR